MKTNMLRVMCLMMALTMVLLCGCKTEKPAGTTAAPQGTTAPNAQVGGTTAPDTNEGGIPDVDLGGYEFIMGDWWSTYEPEKSEPDTAWEQLVADYHDMLETDMNFTFKQIGLQNLGTYNEVLINSFLENKPVCSAFQMNISDFTAMAAQGLLYDLSKLDAFDFENDPKWSQKIIDFYTIDGKIFAARPSEDQPRLGIYFNKRLLEEANIDPDLPYDLQAEGKWDWAHFEELCTDLTRDLNNDGVTDIFDFGGNDCEVMTVGIYGNGAMFVERDETAFLLTVP